MPQRGSRHPNFRSNVIDIPAFLASAADADAAARNEMAQHSSSADRPRTSRLREGNDDEPAATIGNLCGDRAQTP